MATKGGGRPVTAIDIARTAMVFSPFLGSVGYFGRPNVPGGNYFYQAPPIVPTPGAQPPPTPTPTPTPTGLIDKNVAAQWLRTVVNDYGNWVTDLLFISGRPSNGLPLFARASISANANMTHENFTYPNVLSFWRPIGDQPITQDIYNKAVEAANWGVAQIRAGKRILVNCHAGVNRSALVCGLILIRQGMTGMDAYNLLRRQRPGALSNLSFRAVVQNGGHMI